MRALQRAGLRGIAENGAVANKGRPATHRIRPRELMLLLGGALTASRALHAQQKTMSVIGLLNAASPGMADAYLAPLRRGLSETGYVEGNYVAFEYRWAQGHYDRLPSLAVDLVEHNVDVVAAPGGT